MKTSYFLKIDSFSIRQKICDYLEQNKPIIDGLDTKFILELENNKLCVKQRLDVLEYCDLNDIQNIWEIIYTSES